MSARQAAAPASSARSFERVAQVSIMLVIGLAAGAGSFTHVHDVAAAHGQEGWLAWADAVVLELMSIAAGLELRRRKRAHASVAFPGAVLAAAVVLSLGAQVVEAERSALGWIAAAIPALGFLVMVKIALAHAAPDMMPPPECRPARVTSTPAASHVTSAVAAAGLHPEITAGMPASGPESRMAPVTSAPKADPVVSALIPAARAAAAQLDGQGRRLSRRALAEALRTDGYGMSNARASALLSILKSERGDVRPPRSRAYATRLTDQDGSTPAAVSG